MPVDDAAGQAAVETSYQEDGNVESGHLSPEVAENTETEVDGGQHQEQQTIPYTRFREVNEARKAALAELEQMKERLERLEQAASTPKEPERPSLPGELEQPPDEITDPTQRAYWMIQNWGAKAFQEATGYSMRDIGEFVKAQRQQAARNDWNQFCERHGLDPDNKMVQRTMHGAVAAGEDPEAVGKELASVLGRKAPSTAPAVGAAAKVETSGYSGRSLVDDLDPFMSGSEAAALAAKGKVAPYKSTTELFRLRAKKKG